MIVIDSSILVGIINSEQGSDRLLDLLADEDCTTVLPRSLKQGRGAPLISRLAHHAGSRASLIRRQLASFRSAARWQTWHRTHSFDTGGPVDTPPN
jgi:hypothetical protein